MPKIKVLTIWAFIKYTLWMCTRVVEVQVSVGLLYRVVISALLGLNFTVVSRNSMKVVLNSCVNLMVG